jgi:hypothetical protein
MNSAILTPALALITWTLIIWAWIYVALRVVHSLVQNTANKVMIRFSVFALSSVTLITLTAINLLALA